MSVQPLHSTLAVLALFVVVASAHGQSADRFSEDRRDPADATTPQLWDDPVEALVPIRKRTGQQQDQLHAGALYATGRTLFHRGDLAGALRHYQRAWRWDPSASDILGDIVALAFSLERPQEAVRYALLAAEHGDSDALMLRRLALFVTEEGNWPQAIKLYRRWLAHPDTKLSRNELDKLLVQLEVGRLEFLGENTEAASSALAEIQKSFIQAGENSSLGKRLRRALGDDLNATWELCAMAHFEAGAYDLAAEALAQIDLPLDEAGRLGYLKAQVALERGDPVAAWEQLRAYLSAGIVEDGSEPYELLSEVFKQLNQPDAFLLELGKLHQENPHNPALTIALGSEFERRNQVPGAIELYRSVALSDDDVPNALLVEAATRLIELHSGRGEADQLWDVLVTVSDKLRGAVLLENALEEIARHPGLVDRLLELADKTKAVNTAPRAMAVASLLLAAKRSEQAQQYFEQAIDLDADERVERTLGWGLALLAADEFELAASVFRQAVDDGIGEAGDPLFHYYLSMALAFDDQTDEALRVARTAAEMRRDDVEFAAHVPWVLYHANRKEDAIREYEAVLARFDDERDSGTRDELRDVRSSLSNLMVLEGNLSAAEEWLQQILDEFPEDVGAKNDLGYLWADADKHLARAHEMIETAVAAEPENAAYRDSLGWVLYRRGEFDAAKRELERAVELSRGEAKDESQADAIILDHLGDACLRTGDVDDAVKYWRLAVEGLEENEPQRAVATREKIAQHGRGE